MDDNYLNFYLNKSPQLGTSIKQYEKNKFSLNFYLKCNLLIRREMGF